LLHCAINILQQPAALNARYIAASLRVIR